MYVKKLKHVFVILVIFLITTIPTSSANEVLINGTGYALSTEESWNFYQGYVLTIKGVDAKGENVWIELSRNNEVVKYRILSVGDTFIYSKNISNIIFSAKIKNIYTGPKSDLVLLHPVYQYLDTDLPPPIPTNNSISVTPNINKTAVPIPNSNKVSLSGFEFILSIFIALLVAYFIYCFRYNKILE
ncbi:MAG TPA: hypothetical protein EYP22_04585 [Methanosarcinales archaeon]|nr:hypothetical protein [Methanosarcinales archaeon]